MKPRPDGCCGTEQIVSRRGIDASNEAVAVSRVAHGSLSKGQIGSPWQLIVARRPNVGGVVRICGVVSRGGKNDRVVPVGGKELRELGVRQGKDRPPHGPRGFEPECVRDVRGVGVKGLRRGQESVHPPIRRRPQRVGAHRVGALDAQVGISVDERREDFVEPIAVLGRPEVVGDLGARRALPNHAIAEVLAID